MAGMDWLNCVAKFIEDASESRKGPASTALSLPSSTIIFERAEGDESIVGGAATEDFGARMTDMRIS